MLPSASPWTPTLHPTPLALGSSEVPTSEVLRLCGVPVVLALTHFPHPYAYSTCSTNIC